MLPLALVLVALLPSVARADMTREASATYYGSGFFTAPTGCFDGLGNDPNIAGACFEVDDFENTADVEIADVTGLHINVDLAFIVGSTLLGTDSFCSPGSAKLPEGTTELVVSVDDAGGAAFCDPPFGVGTTGTINVTFHKPDDAG